MTFPASVLFVNGIRLVMAISNELGFYFDEMAQLANENPREFACRREALILQLLAKSRQLEDLARLEMDLDAERYCSAQGIRATRRQGMMLSKIELTDGYLPFLPD